MAGSDASVDAEADVGVDVEAEAEAAPPVFNVVPVDPVTLTVTLGEHTPTATYSALLDSTPTEAAWSVNRADIGTIPAGPSTSAEFVPTGFIGGSVSVSAQQNGETLSRQVFVHLTATSNGADPSSPLQAAQVADTVSQLKTGGGVGGVGGEGLGPAVTDTMTLQALKTPTGDFQAQGLKFLYPYNNTMWLRGMPAPLLMWDWSLGDADAVKIELATTSGSFLWSGTYGRPPILAQTGGHFTRHPIPQDIWNAATQNAGGGDRITVKLTVANGGVGYGPVTEDWGVAPGYLNGTIYYNSYGTELVKNYSGAQGGDGMFGGAVLSVRLGDTAPKLVAGNNGGASECRTCHSVAAGGSRLVAQQGDNYNASSAYDLSPAGSTETEMTVGGIYPAVTPDGSLALLPQGQLVSLPFGAMLPSSGLPSGMVAMPCFSFDGKKVVFSPGAGKTLTVMDFDASTSTFSNSTVVAESPLRVGWASFVPGGGSIVFEQEFAPGTDGSQYGILFTRYGARGQISWTTTVDSLNAVVLNQLNGLDSAGTSYLPALSSAQPISCQQATIDPIHEQDAYSNYEPSVSRLVAGRYAWVIFTSRRMYGNVATIPPFCSDPREVDLVQNITTRKLWMAAIDLNALPGTDASFPAFYLPGQEILGGNARGVLTLDPCRSDGEGCQSGEQCCNGYCRSSTPGSSPVCSAAPTGQCFEVGEKCATSADCCDSTAKCIDGFCELM